MKTLICQRRIRPARRAGITAALLAIIASGAPLLPITSAEVVLDQQVEPFIGQGELEINTAQSVAQTFTVATSGRLQRIDVLVRPLHPAEARDLTLTLTTTSAGGLPSGTVLAVHTIPASALPRTTEDSAWARFDLGAFNIPVAAGDRLAIALSDDTAAGDAAYAWEGSLPGPYVGGSTFLLGVIDGRDMAFRTYVETAPNHPPTAIATVGFPVVVGQPVKFDGTTSTDPDDDMLTYSWTVTSAPAGSTACLTSALSSQPTLTPDLPGVYEVTLRASDPSGPGTTAIVQVLAVRS